MDREFIVDQLIGLGFSPINLGFDCLTEALLLVIADPGYIHGITTRLYPDVAENCSSTKAKVERNIRAEISRVLRNDDRLLARIGSGVPISKITNGHLISVLSRYMIKQYDLQNSLKRGATL